MTLNTVKLTDVNVIPNKDVLESICFNYIFQNSHATLNSIVYVKLKKVNTNGSTLMQKWQMTINALETYSFNATHILSEYCKDNILLDIKNGLNPQYVVVVEELDTTNVSVVTDVERTEICVL